MIFWNKLWNIKRLFGIYVQLLSETFAILRTVRDIVIMYIGLHVK